MQQRQKSFLEVTLVVVKATVSSLDFLSSSAHEKVGGRLKVVKAAATRGPWQIDHLRGLDGDV